MNSPRYKILIAGVGGQGIVYISNILAEAALQHDIPIHISEIHGLSQRGGTVTSGIGLGEGCTGFVGIGNVDLLLGLEPLETQRCLAHLHTGSGVVFGGYKMPPASVNEGRFAYPDTSSLIRYLKENCKQVLYAGALPTGVLPVTYNMYLLGVCTSITDFPFDAETLTNAMHKVLPEHHLQGAVDVFRRGVAKSKEIVNEKV